MTGKQKTGNRRQKTENRRQRTKKRNVEYRTGDFGLWMGGWGIEEFWRIFLGGFW